MADAKVNTTPLVTISAQGGLGRINKESHQIVDLGSVFRPITQWTGMVLAAQSIPGMGLVFHAQPTNIRRLLHDEYDRSDDACPVDYRANMHLVSKLSDVQINL